jgi:23S rRNA (cytidine1920-2'-O)/16S rRNA (cytidine1409-2'-O)-methyltransferase
MKQRLDQEMVIRHLVPTRSQAESFIRLGKVHVNKRVVTKTGTMVSEADNIQLTAVEQYVSRAGLKLSSVAQVLKLNFKGMLVLDVGSSTGGFTDYALRHGARRVIAVDVGTEQLHPSLRGNANIELHEKTDIRTVRLAGADNVNEDPALVILHSSPQIVLIDVSFISLREILPTIARLANNHTKVVAMVKPQFEAGADTKHKGVIKNDRMRRDILKEFESWVQRQFVILDKADSDVAGAKGNRERFYLLKRASS